MCPPIYEIKISWEINLNKKIGCNYFDIKNFNFGHVFTGYWLSGYEFYYWCNMPGYLLALIIIRNAIVSIRNHIHSYGIKNFNVGHNDKFVHAELFVLSKLILNEFIPNHNN